jgi:hypothetical protein
VALRLARRVNCRSINGSAFYFLSYNHFSDVYICRVLGEIYRKSGGNKPRINVFVKKLWRNVPMAFAKIAKI